MTLHSTIERILELDKTGFTSDDTPWRWRNDDYDTRLDDSAGNWLLKVSDRGSTLETVDNVPEIITEYRTACPRVARALKIACEALKKLQREAESPEWNVAQEALEAIEKEFQ